MGYFRLYKVGSRVHQKIESDSNLTPLQDYKSDFSLTVKGLQSMIALAPTSKWVFLRFNDALTRPDPSKDHHLRRRIEEHALTGSNYVDALVQKSYGRPETSRPALLTPYLHQAGNLKQLLRAADRLDQFLSVNATYQQAQEAYQHTFGRPLNVNNPIMHDSDDDYDNESNDSYDDDNVSQLTRIEQNVSGSLIAVSAQNNETIIALPYHQLTTEAEDIPTGKVPDFTFKQNPYRQWTWYGSKTDPRTLMSQLCDKFHCAQIFDASGVDQSIDEEEMKKKLKL